MKYLMRIIAAGFLIFLCIGAFLTVGDTPSAEYCGKPHTLGSVMQMCSVFVMLVGLGFVAGLENSRD